METMLPGLNKVIFINSADMPYVELPVNANLQINGTQATGKSTIERALLYCYNVDKEHLGITHDQKPFDEFYLPYENSYIIYEFCKTDMSFMLVCYKESYRAVFRILECPYRKDYFFMDEKNAYSNWNDINRAIGSDVIKSGVIREYKEVRNMIYGQYRDLHDPSLRRYSLMDNPTGAKLSLNLAVQNIYLNGRISNASFKKTILDTFDTTAPKIDVNYYKSEIENFISNYNDVKKWFTKNDKGVVVVREKAEKVLGTYKDYQENLSERKNYYQNLLYSLTVNREFLNTLKLKCDALKVEKNNKEGERGTICSDWTKENNELQQQIGVANNYLKECDEKSKLFEMEKITDIKSKIETLDQTEQRKKSLEESLKELMAPVDDIERKYKRLRTSLDNECNAIINSANAKLFEAKEKHSKSLFSATDERDKKLKSEKESYESAKESLNDEISKLKNKEFQLNYEIKNISNYNPLKNEWNIIEKLRSNIEKDEKILMQDDGSSRVRKTEIQSQIDQVNAKYDGKEAIEKVNAGNTIGQIRESIARKQQLLDNQKGSFIEWLKLNKPGWEKTIGKVVDEDSILYNKSLSPVLVNQDDSLCFGVQMDLEVLKNSVQTPEKIQEDINALEVEITKKQEELQAIINDLQSQREKELIQPKKELEDILKAIEENNVKTIELDGRRRDYKKQVQVYDANLKQEQSELNKRLHEELDSCTLDQKKKQNEAAELNESHRNSEKQINETYELVKKRVDGELSSQKEICNNVLSKADADLKKSLSDLEESYQKELHGENVDIVKIQQCKDELHIVCELLDFIKENRPLYNDYIIYKRDYFDKRDQWIMQRDNLKKTHEAKYRNYQSQLASIDKELEKISVTLTAASEKMEKTQRLINEVDQYLEVNCDDFPTSVPLETVMDLDYIFNHLKELISSTDLLFNNFKSACRSFVSQFSAGNMFNIPINLSEDNIDDFKDVVNKIKDILDQNEQGLMSKRKISVSTFKDIFSCLVQDFQEMEKTMVVIRRTIDRMNNYFRRDLMKCAISKIELRVSENNLEIIKLIRQIYDLYRESFNDFNGDNLFADSSEMDESNQKLLSYFDSFLGLVPQYPGKVISVGDLFDIEFNIKENNNETHWVKDITRIGSEGVNIMVITMLNIMLIHIIKEQIRSKTGNFRVHCFMDEIGRLHPENITALVNFANNKGITVVAACPQAINHTLFQYNYVLAKKEINGEFKTYLELPLKHIEDEAADN